MYKLQNISNKPSTNINSKINLITENFVFVKHDFNSSNVVRLSINNLDTPIINNNTANINIFNYVQSNHFCLATS